MTVTGWNEGHRAEGRKVGTCCPFSRCFCHLVLVEKDAGDTIRTWASPENLWKTSDSALSQF